MCAQAVLLKQLFRIKSEQNLLLIRIDIMAVEAILFRFY
jgi:hypothetical protein